MENHGQNFRTTARIKETLCVQPSSVQPQLSYLLFLEQKPNWMLEKLDPYGMAMCTGDVVETYDRLLGAFQNHSNQGGAGRPLTAK